MTSLRNIHLSTPVISQNIHLGKLVISRTLTLAHYQSRSTHERVGHVLDQELPPDVQNAPRILNTSPTPRTWTFATTQPPSRITQTPRHQDSHPRRVRICLLLPQLGPRPLHPTAHVGYELGFPTATPPEPGPLKHQIPDYTHTEGAGLLPTAATGPTTPPPHYGLKFLQP